MHISKLTIVNYRNFSNAVLFFNKGVNTIVGENGSGKSNLFRAVRLLLDDNMVRSSYRLDESDFHRGLRQWQGHWIIISVEFDEVGPSEAIQALLLHGTGVVQGESVGRATYNLIFRPKKNVRMQLAALENGDVDGLARVRQAITIADYETVFTGRSEADFGSARVYTEIVGDFEACAFGDEVDDPRIGARVPIYLSVQKEVSLTFIQALRDVVAEFHNNRTNPLLTLLKSKSGQISPTTMAPIVAQVQALNSSIEALDDVQTVRTNIRDTIKDAAGETYSPASLSIRSDLSDEAEQLFQSLRLFVGESGEGYEGAIHELSLGGANLIFLALKLLEFKYQKESQSAANFLLIEEPEAHIHTHIQKTLFDRITYSDTQIIYSTHSTNISEVSNVKNMNILGMTDSYCEAYQPSKGLADAEIEKLQRYLDAVRSNLLFAKSVVLVEGDAEEILIPILFKKVTGLSLDELGVSLINIRSTGFQNVAMLFHNQRIRKRCCIVTDLDEAIIDTIPDANDPASIVKKKRKCLAAQVAGARRKEALERFAAGNQWLSVYYSRNTFEVDFVSAGNVEEVASSTDRVYLDETTRIVAKNELSSGDKAKYGSRVVTMAENLGKGWFAILLGEFITHKTALPEYIWKAIFFARPRLSVELFFNVFSYRMRCALEAGNIDEQTALHATSQLDAFRRGQLALASLKEKMIAALPSDQIHKILADVT